MTPVARVPIAGEQLEPGIEPRHHRADIEPSQLGARQLQRERQSVEPTTEFTRDLRVGVGNRRTNSRCRRRQQLHRGVIRTIARGERFHPDLHLVDQPERFTARDEDSWSDGATQYGLSNPSRGRHDVLAVVQDHDGVPTVQDGTQPFGEIARARQDETSSIGDHLRQAGAFIDRYQIDEPHPVRTASSTSCAAAAKANRVFPIPPIPTKLTRRFAPHALNDPSDRDLSAEELRALHRQVVPSHRQGAQRAMASTRRQLEDVLRRGGDP